MKLKNKLYIAFIAVFSLYGAIAHTKVSPLNLSSASELFEGDWLDTWEDPKDYRFNEQGIDLIKYFKSTTPIREELFNIRKKYAEKFYELEKSPKADYLGLGKEITDATMDFVRKYLEKTKPSHVSNDDFAFISFGSMARGESGIITDLEGSLVWDDKMIDKEGLGVAYGQSLSNVLNGLLGHPIYGTRGFRLDEAEHSPFHRAPWAYKMALPEAFCWAARATPRGGNEESVDFRENYFFPFEGSWVYTNNTPESLANFVKSGFIDSWPGIWSKRISKKDFDTEWYRWVKAYLSPTLIQESYIKKSLRDGSCSKDWNEQQLEKYARAIASRLHATEIATISNFPQLSRNRVFVYGNKKLFDQFDEIREKILNDNHSYLRKKLSFKYIKEMLDYFGDPKRGLVDGEATGIIDIKRVNYRFEEQVYTNLGFLLDLPVQGQSEIIKVMLEKGLLGKDYGARALARVNQIFRLRLKKQIVLQTQLDTNMLFLKKDAYDDKLKSLYDDKNKLENRIREDKPDHIKTLEDKERLMNIKADLALMPKLIPGDNDAVFSKNDIDYIKDTLFIEQADVLKRLKKFYAENKDKMRGKFDFSAFSD